MTWISVFTSHKVLLNFWRLKNKRFWNVKRSLSFVIFGSWQSNIQKPHTAHCAIYPPSTEESKSCSFGMTWGGEYDGRMSFLLKCPDISGCIVPKHPPSSQTGSDCLSVFLDGFNLSVHHRKCWMRQKVSSGKLLSWWYSEISFSYQNENFTFSKAQP